MLSYLYILRQSESILSCPWHFFIRFVVTTVSDSRIQWDYPTTQHFAIAETFDDEGIFAKGKIHGDRIAVCDYIPQLSVGE